MSNTITHAPPTVGTTVLDAASRQADKATDIAAQLKKQPKSEQDEEEIRLIERLAEAYRAEAPTSAAEMDLFQRSHQREAEALGRAMHRLDPETGPTGTKRLP